MLKHEVESVSKGTKALQANKSVKQEDCYEYLSEYSSNVVSKVMCVDNAIAAGIDES